MGQGQRNIRFLRVDPAAATPIWSQIEEGVRRLVASGALAASSPMPSVRDLARELAINPATVAKAYQHLADAGLLSVRRGEGTYVADRPPKMSRAERGRALREAATRFAAVAAAIGADRAQAAEELTAAWNALGNGASKGEQS